MYVSVVSVIEEVKKKEQCRFPCFHARSTQCNPPKSNPFNFHIYNALFSSLLSTIALSLSPQYFLSLSLSLYLSQKITFLPLPVLYDSVAATSTPLLPLLGAKLPSILLLASCISAFVGLSFC